MPIQVIAYYTADHQWKFWSEYDQRWVLEKARATEYSRVKDIDLQVQCLRMCTPENAPYIVKVLADDSAKLVNASNIVIKSIRKV